MEKKERVVYTDLLRIIAIFGVILIHTTANILLTCPVGSAEWYSANALTSLVRFSVPVFLMISGVFFLDPGKDMPIKKIFGRNILRLVVALVFWAILYELYYVIAQWLETRVFPWDMLGQGLMKVAEGRTHFHLYFIYIIVGLYIVSPILRVITKHATRRQIEYFLMLFFLFSGVIPFITKVEPFSGFAYNITQMQMHLVIGYTGYFLAGYYFNTYELSKRATRVIYALGVLAWIAAGTGTAWLSVQAGAVDVSLYEGLSPLIMFFSSAVFLFVKNLRLCKNISPKGAQTIAWVAKTTFGIYLMHDFCNMLLAGRGIWLKNYNVLAVAPLYSVLVFVICMAITGVLLKIPGVKKYLV